MGELITKSKNNGFDMIVGVIKDDYHNDKSKWSNSMFKKLEKSYLEMHMWWNGFREPTQDKFAKGQYGHVLLARHFDPEFVPEFSIVFVPKIDKRTKKGKEDAKALEDFRESQVMETYFLTTEEKADVERLFELAEKNVKYFDTTKYKIVSVEQTAGMNFLMPDPEVEHNQESWDKFFSGIPMENEFGDNVINFQLRGAADAIFEEIETGRRIVVDWKFTEVFDTWRSQFYKMKYARAAVIYKYAFENIDGFDFCVFNMKNSREARIFSLSVDTERLGIKLLRNSALEAYFWMRDYEPEKVIEELI